MGVQKERKSTFLTALFVFLFWFNAHFFTMPLTKDFYRTGVTNMVPAGTRSPARAMYVARGPVLKITIA